MILVFANQKGGVSKTTTAAAIVSALYRSNKKVLAVDADPQGSLSYLLGADMDAPGIIELIQGDGAADQAIQTTDQADIIAGNKLLAALQNSIAPTTLKDRLKPFVKKYDYIIIDTGPSLSNILITALRAADRVIIPAKLNAGSIQGVEDTVNTIGAITPPLKKKTQVLITQVHSNKTNAEKAFFDAIRQTCEDLKIPVLDTVIRYAEAPITSGEAFRQSIITYDPKSKPALDYFQAAEELNLI